MYAGQGKKGKRRVRVPVRLCLRLPMQIEPHGDALNEPVLNLRLQFPVNLGALCAVRVKNSLAGQGRNQAVIVAQYVGESFLIAGNRRRNGVECRR